LIIAVESLRFWAAIKGKLSGAGQSIENNGSFITKKQYGMEIADSKS